MKHLNLRGSLTRLWAWAGILLVIAVILFLFLFVFINGGDTISREFLTQPPRGAVLGEEGGIFPAIIGSLWFTGLAVILGGIPAIATAVYVVFCCKRKWMEALVRGTMQTISGIPSIVLGLFSYSFLVRQLGLGRCILSSSVALAVMILPFIEVRAEKAFRELPDQMIRSSLVLGCSTRYTVWHIVLPACRGELVSGVILGACYAMGATAPLIFTGAVAFAGLPDTILAPAMALPLHLYLLLAQGATSMNMAYGTALVMMVIILVLSLVSTLYAQRSQRKWKA